MNRIPSPSMARAAFSVLALWPLLAFVAYSIFIRIQSKYFAALLSISGLEGSDGAVHRLFLYRNDLLLIGVVLPLLMMGSLYLLRGWRTRLAWGAFVLASMALLYSNLQSWGQVGRFLNWQALINAISFGLSKPEFIGDYLALDGLAKLALLILLSAAALVAAGTLKDRSMVLRVGAALGLAGIVACLAAALVGHSSDMKRAPIAGSFYANAWEALLIGDAIAAPAPVAAADLDAQFEAVSLGRLNEYRGPSYGAATGMNLLLFVMETGSIEFLDVRKGLPAHPVLERLKPHLFVAPRHFSTFPASAESNLSILTGLYPPRAIYDTCLVDPSAGGNANAALPGFIPQLRRQGYRTALYAPFRSQVPADKVVFEMTGFENIVYGQDLDPKAADGADASTFRRLSEDVAGWARRDERFAVGYFPQVGHGPWSPALGVTIADRGHRLAITQLDWLQKIVESLERSGQLARTVIVLTGDHGVRTSLEDPRVRVGMVDRYSLHVPLLIYAPGADYSGWNPGTTTSHVDVAVELAQLFGLPRTPAMQGLAFHDPGLLSRRQFFVANWYYGADGFRDPKGSAMFSMMLNVAYWRPDGELDFDSGHLLRQPEMATDVKDKVNRMLNLQESWIRLRACEARVPLR